MKSFKTYINVIEKYIFSNAMPKKTNNTINLKLSAMKLNFVNFFDCSDMVQYIEEIYNVL